MVDDYGHHPAEIKATLAGARAASRRGGSSWPSSPTATPAPATCSTSSPRAFNDADSLLLTEIYAAGEDAIPGVTGAKLARRVRACGHRDANFAERGEMARKLREMRARATW